MKLMEDYKKEPGGKEKLNERNPKWINDDYVKFIRYGQHFIEKNGEGILAFINPHGFLDNPTFRGMRWNLLKTFDKIYTIDLHGNSKKKETADDGTIDENVFDIQQGVSINFFIKTGTKKSIELGKVFHFDLFGKREMKYDFLNEKSLYTVSYKEIPNSSPNYFFVVKDFGQQTEYEKGFQISDLFTVNSVGIVTARDNFTIHNSKDEVKKTIEEFLRLDDETARKRFDLGKDVRDWQVNYARKDLENAYSDKSSFQKISYRPFDDRWTFYTGKTKGFHCYPRYEIMRHLLKNENIGIAVSRQTKMDFWKHCLISKNPTTALFVEIKDSSNFFPLYLYPEPNAQQTIDQPAGRVPNLNMEIVNQIADKLGLSFVPEKNSPPSNGARNSPPSEGCPQGGVVGSPPPEGWSKTGVVINSTPIIRNFVENLPYNPALKQRARDKRKAGILSEVLFWQQVHKGMFHNIDFDRQRIIGNYIVDFYVKTLGLVVEIDGSSHINKVEYDRIRQQYLESFGLRVYRIADIDVKKNLSWVMAELEKYIVKEYGECTTPVFDHPSNGGECTTPPCGHPSDGGEFAPVDLLDYIYAILHSPSYREKYKEFLKIDFPRVPYPKDKTTFWQLVKLGEEIRQIHLLESQVVNNFITKYPVGGSNEVGKVRFEISENETHDSGASTFGKVWINDEQYFANVPQVAWEFYIGGYQPAQKWLKDRKGRELQIEDILHYQKIIVALSETDRLMKEIDQIDL